MSIEILLKSRADDVPAWEGDKLLHPDFGMPAPPCFPRSIFFGWDEWVNAEIEHYTGPTPSGYCTHCLPHYQKRMKREGRCAHPEVKFELSEDGFEGKRPETKITWLTLVEGE